MNVLMTNRRKAELIECTYFTWRMRLRGKIWYADGRGNKPNPGRHSLDASDYEEALQSLRQLDLLRAVELGLADASLLYGKKEKIVTLEEGLKAYFDHLRVPRVAGGVHPESIKRYKPVFDKFLPVAKAAGIHCWNYLKRHHLESYAAWLDGEGYAYATEFLELTTIKQLVNYLIDAELLPSDCKIRMKLPKPTGTDTFCYREEQVTAMLERCGAVPELTWMRNVIAALAFTGMRISELAGLRKSDLDFERNVITLTDERYRRRVAGGKARTIKNRKSRTFPILPNLKPILEAAASQGDSSTVFLGPSGLPLRPDFVRIVLKRDVLAPLEKKFPSAEDEIGFKDGRLHSFRHFFCSLCANRGVPELTVMDWLGHGSSLMVRHYYHLNDQESQRQMAKVSVNWWPDSKGTEAANPAGDSSD